MLPQCLPDGGQALPEPHTALDGTTSTPTVSISMLPPGPQEHRLLRYSTGQRAPVRSCTSYRVYPATADSFNLLCLSPQGQRAHQRTTISTWPQYAAHRRPPIS